MHICDPTVTCTVHPLGTGRYITPNTLSIQMVDHSLTYPQGIFKDMLLKVDNFIFPVDFVVL